MSIHDCDGWVRSLRGHHVTFTGRVRINGIHHTKKECRTLALGRGADAVVQDFSHSLTLLVYGELNANVVADPDQVYSRKLLAVQEARALRHPHVHVVDSAGFANLLKRKPAPCRRLGSSKGTTVVLPAPGNGVFGGPLVVHRGSTHPATILKEDLDKLDAGTVAHQDTVKKLQEHLTSHGILALRPAPGAPAFDIGWTKEKTLYVGEVKSLGGVKQDQQIRLGLGQVLDYTHRLASTAKVKPVLILEKRPKNYDHWESLARSLRVVLTYGPSFPEV